MSVLRRIKETLGRWHSAWARLMATARFNSSAERDKRRWARLKREYLEIASGAKPGAFSVPIGEHAGGAHDAASWYVVPGAPLAHLLGNNPDAAAPILGGEPCGRCVSVVRCAACGEWIPCEEGLWDVGRWGPYDHVRDQGRRVHLKCLSSTEVRIVLKDELDEVDGLW